MHKLRVGGNCCLDYFSWDLVDSVDVEYEETDAQLDAINSRGRTVLVCAAAGSGKTATLTERIIRRLTDENDPSDISRMVVVTFTRNAATDLKNKIYDALSKKLKQDPQNKFIALQMMKLPQARISTIHSFCYDIVKKNAASLGLSSSVKIGDSTECELMAARIMDTVVCEYYDREEKDGGVYDFSMLAESMRAQPGPMALNIIITKQPDNSQPLQVILQFLPQPIPKML